MKRIFRSALTCVIALLAALAPASSARSAMIAQFGLGNLTNALGAGKDLAVKAALSTFGKSLGDQLPIVVGTADAYPTTPNLPGPPFSPMPAPNIAAALRTSRDGTVMLPPGDYTFGVGVFCMQAHAGSPPAHRYLVAPLHGSAADIVSALNSRIPSFAIDHHVLQILSWDIQAGVAYDAMQPAQRTAVDRIIPDYRGRLNGDVYERIRDQYTNTAANIPGMPSFEQALTRVGPVGAQVVALQNLRQELAQPPPTFEQLAHALVPILPAGSLPNPSGDTPWSRYSERVYVRFVTAGNYATPGTYQVRVLPPSGSAASNDGPNAPSAAPVSFSDATPRLFVNTAYVASPRAVRIPPPLRVAAVSPAGVPFTNIVNNPGTDAVQPLTQTPLSGPALPLPSPVPSPSPSSSPIITSVTNATLPEDRHRTIVGVGEPVLLTFTGGYAEWTIDTAKDGIVEPVGDQVLYTAASQAAHETITAKNAHGSAKISFDVIEPNGQIGKQAPCTEAFHLKNRPNSGMLVIFYITPDTVSFQYIDTRELEVPAIGTGVYSYLNGEGHGPGPGSPVSAKVVPGLGSLANTVDLAYTGDSWLGSGFFGPYAPGYLVWNIPVQYKVRAPNQGSAAGAAWHPFANNFVSVQSHLLAADGQTLTTSKDGAHIQLKVSDPTTDEPTPAVRARETAKIRSCPQPP